MNKRKTPCVECPFLKDSLPGWLGPHTPEELHSFVNLERPFPCHMTHEGLSWEEVEDGAAPLCAGFLLFAKKNAKLFVNG